MRNTGLEFSALTPLLAGAAFFCSGLTGLGVTSLPGASSLLTSLQPASAFAASRAEARRVARRTSRRTSRRVARRHSIAGCVPYNLYYNCSGVYYAPYVENGVTVYVVVNP